MHNINSISYPLALYFPAKILFLDDKLPFLQSLSLEIPNLFNYQLETAPQECLQSLKKQGPLLDTNIISALSDLDMDNTIECAINFNVRALYQKLYQAQRFKHFGVVVVDQCMPQMNGVDFCSKLLNSCIKKIMLTGEGDSNLATTAFNQGYIDQYIEKNNPSVYLELETIINSLRHKYFHSASASLMQAISLQSQTFIFHAEFLTVFNDFLQKYKIVEFYLLDMMGSYVGLDAKGHAYWFLVKHNNQLESLADIAADEVKIANSIKTKKAFPYFLTAAEEELSVSQWPQLMHKVTQQVDDFSIAVVKGDKVVGFIDDKVKSLTQYLTTQNIK